LLLGARSQQSVSSIAVEGDGFMRQRNAQFGFTLVEILVTLAILVLLFGLLFRPLMTAMDILSTGRTRSQVADTVRTAFPQLVQELEEAVWVRSNYSYFDTLNNLLKVPQPSRLDLLLPARDATGQLLTPLMPQVAPSTGAPVYVTYYLHLLDPTVPYDETNNPFRLYRAEYPGTAPDPDVLWAGDSRLDPNNYPWAVKVYPNPTDGAALPTVLPPIQRGESAVTNRDVNVVNLAFRPTGVENDTLKPNANYTSLEASHGLWIRPYQLANGSWIMPGGPMLILPPDLDGDGNPDNRSGGLAQTYLIDVDPATGHPWVKRGDDQTPVYDTTLYPRRTPGQPVHSPDSNEFACGIDWEQGRLLFAFPRQETIPADGSPGPLVLPLFGPTNAPDDDLLPDLSLVPGSERVTVVFPSGERRSYAVFSTVLGNFPANLSPYQCALDVGTGELRFSPTAPPPLGASIRVEYQYRNNLPTEVQIALWRQSRGSGSNPPSEIATLNYLTRSKIEIDLTLSMPSDSNKPSLSRYTVRLTTEVSLRNVLGRR